MIAVIEYSGQRLDALAPAKLLHDPSKGFHDIKPLPEFHPIPLSLIIGLAAIAALLLLFAYWYKKQAQREGMRLLEQQVPPHIRALDELRNLERAAERNALSVDELSARASFALRRYLEEIYNFPATDCTTKELVARLPSRLESMPTFLPTSESKSALEQTRALLGFFDYLSFAADAATKYSGGSSQVKQNLSDTAALVHSIQQRVEQQQALNPGDKSDAV
ncbi:MAG: hypothetical protein KDD66_05550 [Bdellovibrionales bacterium]|nr:hypothetical protein [Bdellovibrionales bacterium]